jgi:hypothetical protein
MKEKITAPDASPRTQSKKKATKPSGKTTDENNTQAVNEYMTALSHPFKAEMEAVRKITLDANHKLKERIKWNAPSFYYKKDLAAFNTRAQDCLHIVFVFYDGEMVTDDIGLLKGDYKDRRMVKFYSMQEIESKKEVLIKIVNDWVSLIDKHHKDE